MTAEQMRLLPADRKSMMSVVIPAWHEAAELATEKLTLAEPIGVLSIDTTTTLSATGWREDLATAEILQNWAKILARVLS